MLFIVYCTRHGKHGDNGTRIRLALYIACCAHNKHNYNDNTITVTVYKARCIRKSNTMTMGIQKQHFIRHTVYTKAKKDDNVNTIRGTRTV